MNDDLIINGSHSLIYAICIYDTEKKRFKLFQVSHKYKLIFLLFNLLYK
jgi:hypothetical protein